MCNESVRQFVFPEQGGFGGGSAMEGALLGSMMNGGMNGGMGSWANSPWWALIFLSAFRNGFFGGNGENGSLQLSDIQEQLNTIQGQNALMSAIQGSTNEVRSLANTLNCDVNAVQGAINAVQSAICNLGQSTQLGQQGIINAVNTGNNDIVNQLCSCCCDLKQLVTTQGYQNQLANCQQTNTFLNGFNQTNVGLERGFSNVAFAAQQQTCALQQTSNENTRAILAKLDQIEDSRKDREISNLTAQLTAANSRAERQSELAPIYQALSDIQCKQPATKTIVEPNNYIPVQASVNVPLTYAGCGCGFNGFGAYPFGFNNLNGVGFTNAF